MADVSCLAVTQPSPATTEISDAPQVATLKPRPAEPAQRLTAAPLPRDLDPYKAPEATKPATTQATYSPWVRPGALLARDLYDSHAALGAFGDDLPDGAA